MTLSKNNFIRLSETRIIFSYLNIYKLHFLQKGFPAVLIYLTVISAVFLITAFYLFTAFKSLFVSRQNIKATESKFSIVIAAKNESRNIPALTEALNKIDYPKSLYEIILVDDNSEDGTKDIFDSLIDKTIDYNIIRSGDKKYEGKKGALSIGIENSKYPFILITDADCVPSPGWLNCYDVKFREGYDFIMGIAPFTPNKNFTSRLSCFENLRSIFLSFSLAKAGVPYNAAARNAGFTRAAFNAVKGYANTTETLSGDDDLLLREMVKRKLKIGLMTDEKGFVYSETENNLADFFRQRGRHTTTSFFYSRKAQLSLGYWHIINLFFLFTPTLMLLDWRFISLFIIKILTDVFIVSSFQKKLKYNFNLIQIIYLQISYELLLIVSMFNAKFTKVKWK